jgi:hypothetical protein
MSNVKGSLPVVLATLAAVLGSSSHAAPLEFVDRCYVRQESASPAAGAASGPTQSYLGLRRKATQLVEVSVSVAAANGAVCSVAGIAKLRGSPGAEYLSLVVRPDGRASADAPCQLRIQGTATAVELATTEPACRAQSLCAGLVQLDGQRFELSARVPDGVRGPCFAQPGP